jgi:hypothetical protein
MTATNVNGSGTAAVNTTKRIQVHTAAQSGISEIAIACNVSLGDGTFTDTAKRSSYFISSTAFNPTYVNSTNFYTANVYSESSDPGVAGTKEATIRIGTLKYDVTNYSNAFLPPGPDRSGDTGFQYFTFAFRRRGVSSFNLNIVAPSGVANCWIAAPGTTLDSTSQFDGWLRADLVYGGAGKPGSNTGAGGNGTAGTFNTVAPGGVGTSTYSSWGLATTTGQNVSGTVFYAGGGGGFANYGISNGGNGGGGAGNGGSGNGNGVSGTVNTGGGAGATYGAATAGGSGIVIVRYTMV